MKTALHKKELMTFLKNNQPVTTQDLWDFYRVFTPDLPIATLRWRIYELKRQGIIFSPKRGQYACNEKENFQLISTPKMAYLANLLQEKFPYVHFSLYNSQSIEKLANHIYQSNNLIVEIDADVLDAAFYFLKEQFPNTFLSPDQRMYDYYISPQEENIIINRLHVDAPLHKVEKNYYTPKLEKLVIDLVINDPIIFPMGTAEVQVMIKNALDTYNINESTLTRYAQKRHAAQKLDMLVPIGG